MFFNYFYFFTWSIPFKPNWCTHTPTFTCYSTLLTSSWGIPSLMPLSYTRPVIKKLYLPRFLACVFCLLVFKIHWYQHVPLHTPTPNKEKYLHRNKKLLILIISLWNHMLIKRTVLFFSSLLSVHLNHMLIRLKEAFMFLISSAQIDDNYTKKEKETRQE